MYEASALICDFLILSCGFKYVSPDVVVKSTLLQITAAPRIRKLSPHVQLSRGIDVCVHRLYRYLRTVH